MAETKKIENMTDAEYELARLRAWCKLNPQKAAERIRDYEMLLEELIDIEGPQPGTHEWFNKVKATMAKHSA